MTRHEDVHAVNRVKQGLGKHSDAILHAAAYLTAAGVAAAELLALPLGPAFAWTTALICGHVVTLILTLRAAHRTSDRSFILAAAAAWVTATGVVAFGTSPSVGGILFFVICTIAGMRLPARHAVAWVIGSIAALAACLYWRKVPEWFVNTLSFGVGYFAVFAIAIAFHRSLQARAESQELLRELTSAQGRLRDLAIMEERQRLAREMHDAVGHRLTAAAMLLEGASRLIPTEPERATRMVETSRQQVRLGLDELRAAVSSLHAQSGGTQSVQEVLSAIVEVFARGADAHVTLEVDPGLVEPDPDRKLVIIRTSQEALTNVQKHAAASRVELSLRAGDGAYVLTCRDNGRGISPAPDASSTPRGSGFGLRNLRARAEAFGGRVDLEAVPDGGALLRLTLPLPAAEGPRDGGEIHG